MNDSRIGRFITKFTLDEEFQSAVQDVLFIVFAVACLGYLIMQWFWPALR